MQSAPAAAPAPASAPAATGEPAARRAARGEGDAADEITGAIAATARLLAPDPQAAHRRAAALAAAHPGRADVAMLHAGALAAVQDFAGAVAVLDPLWKEGPTPLIAFNLGYCLRQAGDYQGALVKFLEGTVLKPGWDLMALAADTAAVLGDLAFARSIIARSEGPMAALRARLLGVEAGAGNDMDGTLRIHADRTAAILFWMKYDAHPFAGLRAAAVDAGLIGVVDTPLLNAGRSVSLRLFLKTPGAPGDTALLWRGGIVTLAAATPPSGAAAAAPAVSPFGVNPHMRPAASPVALAGSRRTGGQLVMGRDAVIPLEALEPEGRLSGLDDRLATLAGQLVGRLGKAGFWGKVHAISTAFVPRVIGLDVMLDANGTAVLTGVVRYPDLTAAGADPAAARIATRFREDWARLILGEPGGAEAFRPLAVTL
ncbi:hypothetical protein [Acuticoccus yangtzensis]|uniref:hypothetical protein n=1 Tax=Acuticoccus yangtzensis TaxID=1443441 RepID=UPI000949616F|nr:hypothetical protein [Acuticoccus yangtzensis]